MIVKPTGRWFVYYIDGVNQPESAVKTREVTVQVDGQDDYLALQWFVNNGATLEPLSDIGQELIKEAVLMEGEELNRELQNAFAKGADAGQGMPSMPMPTDNSDPLSMILRGAIASEVERQLAVIANSEDEEVG